MRRFLMVVSTAVLYVGLTATVAGAVVDRHQVEERVFSYSVGGFEHTYTLTSACGVESATGYYNLDPSVFTETFESFSLNATTVYFRARHDFGAVYWHEFSGTSTDGGLTYQGFLANDTQYEPATLTLIGEAATGFRNHGEYVRASDDGKQAAQSCIGMPKAKR